MSNPTEGLVADLPGVWTAQKERIVIETIEEIQDAGGWHNDDGGISSLDPADGYLLVERNYRYGRGYWLSSFTTPEQAANCQPNQEYAEDWEPIVLIDLDNGQRFRGVAKIEWYPVAGDEGAIETIA